ncbi:hypothetical protein D0B54_01195 [Solimonas sp. K1W22B-7]|uniref:hypothetical protein n=1 Tax=Solimonas sp. K1W22B-7 TaxID=2303331 RepID=UPI000E3374CB|nr:hypothetical protein [Solimonas sp. K1W22B-7]AXQ27385.1 hypothetical protein D0B54_01195 [Solimonas sp. K1W22B-7]
MRPAQLLAASALALSANAYAASFDSLDLYYTSADLDVKGRASSDAGPVDYNADLDGLDGFGVKFRGSVAEDFFFAGEFQRAEAEQLGLTLTDPDSGASIDGGSNADLSYKEWRLGIGVPFYHARSLTLYGVVEYVNTELKTAFDTTDPDTGATTSNRSEQKQDGGGAHAGALFNPTKAWSLYGQVGYLRLDELDGIEYLAGTALQVHRYGGLFAEYRNSDLEGDGGSKVELTPWRFGVYLLVQ